MSKEMVEGLCQDFADGRIDAIAPKLHDDFVLARVAAVWGAGPRRGELAWRA